MPNTTSNAVESDLYEFLNVDPTTATIDLTELKVWPPRQGERGGNFPVWPELRVAEQTIITDSWRITVHLTRAELAAQFDGCGIAPGTRHGDDPLERTVEMTETEVGERDYSRSGEISAGLSADFAKGLSAKAGMSIDGKANLRSKTAIERRSQINQLRVATLPNNRWEITEPVGKRLRGTYLAAPADEVTTTTPLCRVIADADTVTIALSLEVRPHDIDPQIDPLDVDKWPRWLSRERPNQAKVAKLLITKACTECFVRPGDERITLARTVLRATRLK